MAPDGLNRPPPTPGPGANCLRKRVDVQDEQGRGSTMPPMEDEIGMCREKTACAPRGCWWMAIFSGKGNPQQPETAAARAAGRRRAEGAAGG